MKTPKSTPNMIQTSLWLPSEMHKKLTAGGTKLADEIRRRLEISFKAAQALRDQKTDEFNDAIKRIELSILDVEQWYVDRCAFEVFKAAINHLLSDYEPAGGVQAGTVAKFQNRYGKDEKVETIGRILARAALMAARDKEKE